MEICARENCTGCFACVNICPKSCISMAQNEIGHIYPEINEELCTDCGLCRKTCPANEDTCPHTPKKVYAAWSFDNDEHEKSTSGGIATYLTRKIIENGGVAYGCSSLIENEVHHNRVDNVKDIYKLQGSKYVHSYINDTYSMAKSDLLSGKEVLFIGTPCQISGLNAYLQKAYKNLTTVDLICHGVPPQRLLFDNICNYLGDGSDKTLSFREKKGFYLKISDNTKKVLYYKNEYDDLYYLGFDTALYYRESCYNCKYASSKRCSDITIGDFWGLGKEIPFLHETNNGVSVILSNTVKGQAIIERYKCGLFLEERTLEEAALHNPQLNNPTKKHINNNEFIENYKSLGFETASKAALKKDIKKYKLLKYLQKSKLAMKIIEKLR